MKTSDFAYDLPLELIAQSPTEKRDESRLLVVDDLNEVRDSHFYNLPEFLRPGDTLVLNDTKVMPARLIGTRAGMQRPVEVLLLKRINATDWQCLVNPGRRLKVGSKITFLPGELSAEILDYSDDGSRIVHFEFQGVWEEILDKAGTMPLPPYIHEKLKDQNRYQTVYAKEEGSAAAPTAGLHFTKELLQKLTDMDILPVYLTLHVGLGTFRPVKVENVEEHHMHTEYYVMPEKTAEIINARKAAGGRTIAVGTTSCRVLETVADEHGIVRAQHGDTSIFIYPGYRFKIVDGMITNFHLPESTLMMLVSALAGKAEIFAAYDHAIKERYRFYSFGDAMLIHRRDMHDFKNK